jgi:tRNA A37 methylthiotransferase MiaB
MSDFLFGFPGETYEDRAATAKLIGRIIGLSLEYTHITYRH